MFQDIHVKRMNNTTHVYTHIYQNELKISHKCAMLDVIVFGDLKMGGSYLFCFVILVLHCIIFNNV